jgi:hypothetical protein
MRPRTFGPARFALAALPISLLGLGCNNSQPIDPDALAVQAALSAREIIHQSGDGIAFTRSSDSGLQKILSGMAHTNTALATMGGGMPSSMTSFVSAMNGTPVATAAAGMPSLMTTQEQFDSTADDIQTFLRDRLFAKENLESKTAEEAVYLLKGDPTCRNLPKAGDPTGALTTLNMKCVDDLNKMPVRIVMRADGDGVRLTIELGPDRLELLAVIIHSNQLALETDLAKTYQATRYADQTLGTASPTSRTPLEALEGVVRVSLTKNGEKHVTFATSVLSPIHVAVKNDNGSPGPDVRLAATDPMMALSLDGVAQTAALTIDVGALDVLTTWNPQGRATSNRDLHVALGEITGNSTFSEGQKELVIKGLGVGPTQILAHGVSIFDLGLNPSDNHRFDVRVTVDGANEPHFEITPRFDLAIGAHFGLVASEFAVDHQPPKYALDETYGVKLDNGGAAAKIEAVAANGTFTGGLKVTAGTLTLSSTKAAKPVVVPMDQCLTGASNVPADAHPILGAFAAAACPAPAP